jgi:hypothetical protein
MTSVKGRIARLEEAQRFKRWFEINDLLERFTDEELKIYTETGEFPKSVLCDSFADRPSRLDGVSRKSLLKLFEEPELVLCQSKRRGNYLPRDFDGHRCQAVIGFVAIYVSDQTLFGAQGMQGKDVVNQEVCAVAIDVG